MGRPFKQRETWMADAGYVGRIVQAVELDTDRDKAWRDEVIGHLKSAQMLMINAPEKGKPWKKAGANGKPKGV